MTPKQLQLWADLPYAELAYHVLRLYIPVSEIPDDDLHRLVTKSYSTFRHKEVVPVVQVRACTLTCCSRRIDAVDLVVHLSTLNDVLRFIPDV